MQKKLAAGFLLVAALYLVVHVTVSRAQPDPFWNTVLVVCVDVVIGLGAAWIASRLLTRRIRELVAATSLISGGDLTRRVDTRGEDETADLARSFTSMLESLLNIVLQVQTTAERIQESARALSTNAEEMNAATAGIALAAESIARGADEQAREVAHTTAVTRRLVGSVDDVAECADAVHRATREAADRSASGAICARAATERIADLSDRTERVAEAVEGFRTRASRIGKIVTSISTLSHQTHLLAINASIEAVRAGEDGQGFAVVADEVGRLADDVREFADQISAISSEITEGSGAVASGIRGSVDSARAVRDVVDSAAASFDGILHAIAGAAERADEIRNRTREQREAAGSVVLALDRISTIAGDNADGTENASAATQEQRVSMAAMVGSASELAHTADELRELISLFRVR